MKALTLTQPWATLVALGYKKIETRSWHTKHRGLLLIHAAKSLRPVGEQAGLLALCWENTFIRNLLMVNGLHTGKHAHGLALDALPFGALIAKTTLLDVLTTTYLTSLEYRNFYRHGITHRLSAQEKALGDFSRGRYGWLLSDPVQLEPIPARGYQALWDYDGPLSVRAHAADMVQETFL